MGPVALVLDGHHRVLDALGDLPDGDGDPVLLGVEGGDQATVGVVDLRGLGQRGGSLFFDLEIREQAAPGR
jgi:hypothetical protein